MAQVRAGRTKEEVLKDFRTGEIVQAARRVIAELGFVDASMERIAHEAGVAKGTIYLYFRNKEELLAQALEDRAAHGLDEKTRGAPRIARAQLAALRAALDHACDEAHDLLEILLEPGREQGGILGRELTVLLQRAEDRLVLARVFERRAQERLELSLRAARARRTGARALHHHREAVVGDVREQLFLVGEVQVDRALRDTGLVRDPLHRRIREAELADHATRGLDDLAGAEVLEDFLLGPARGS